MTINTHDPQAADNTSLRERLKLARKQSGKTQQEAADFLGIQRTTIVAMEKGDRPVRNEELVKLAQLYDRSVHELLRPTLPPQDLAVQLRSSIPTASPKDDVSRAVEQLERACDSYMELEQILGAPLPTSYPAEYVVGNLPPDVAAEDAAAAERDRLGIGDGPLTELRSMLEMDVGLRVFALKLPSRIAGLFACTAATGGVIAFNADHPFDRQRWSMAHEYGHFLSTRHQGEVTVDEHAARRSPAERFADTFAKCLLMPTSGLRRRVLRIRQSSPAGVTAADIMRLADYYQVSAQAMTFRLEELKLVDTGTWTRLEADGFRPMEARELLGLPKRAPDEERLPARFRQLAVRAWQHDEISEGQLAELLGADRVASRRIAEEAQP